MGVCCEKISNEQSATFSYKITKLASLRNEPKSSCFSGAEPEGGGLSSCPPEISLKRGIAHNLPRKYVKLPKLVLIWKPPLLYIIPGSAPEFSHQQLRLIFTSCTTSCQWRMWFLTLILTYQKIHAKESRLNNMLQLTALAIRLKMISPPVGAREGANFCKNLPRWTSPKDTAN